MASRLAHNEEIMGSIPMRATSSSLNYSVQEQSRAKGITGRRKDIGSLSSLAEIETILQHVLAKSACK